MAEIDYRTVPDGGVLRRLGSGLQIIRRVKHEWYKGLDARKGEALRRETDKIRGSKFLSDWTLSQYVQWIEAQLAALGWDAQTPSGEFTAEFPATVGYSSGKVVTKIRIELSSRCVHA